MCTFDWTLFLEYLKVIISWPVIAFILAVIMFHLFHKEIANWLRYLVIKKGETEISSNQPSPNTSEKAKALLPDVKIPSIEVLATAETKLSDTSLIAIGKVESGKSVEVTNEIEELKKLVRYYEYSYLNLFYVEHTKRVLIWLKDSGTVAIGTYHTAWSKYIPDARERGIILDVLTTQNLIYVQNGQMTLTEKGSDFITWANLKSILSIPEPPRIY
jgi:hypothetical protein